MARATKPRVLAVAQAFKGTLSTAQVADAMETGIRAAGAEAELLLASDGGDGLLEALGPDVIRRTGHRVTGPLGSPVEVTVGWLDSGTAVIESRLVCGISLVPPAARDPLHSTTRGIGELVAEVVEAGAGTVLVGLGGSATMDGGAGMARVWGFVPLDAQGSELPEGGGGLADLARFRDGRAPAAAILGLTDVRNPLTGDRGARVYAAQKGAGPDAIERLARALDRLATVAAERGKGHLSSVAGAGAAGGLGFGLMYFGNGSLTSGADWFLNRRGFPARLRHARLVVTGEGAFDATSLEGKLTGQVLAAAGRAGVSAALLAPRAERVPAGVAVEAGGAAWDAGELARRTQRVVERALRAGRTG